MIVLRIRALKAMGFSHEVAVGALQATNNDLQLAINALLA